mgnify:CR=1 FL=1
MRYEILSSIEPEREPSATTGDQVGRTELTVKWDEIPSTTALRIFEDQYPVHFYDTFHFVEGVGKVGQNTDLTRALVEFAAVPLVDVP